MNSAIVVNNLSKKYSDGTDAVRGVSFTVDEGEIVGLLGPNGAGKSTTLNMLATLIAPTSGDAEIFGKSIRDRNYVRSQIGVALQVTGLDPIMTVEDHFLIHAALYRVRIRDVRKRLAMLLDVFQLGDIRKRRAGELSGGTQRRLSLALSLLHNPKAIIFDEPTVGLDPNLRAGVWKLLNELRAEGMAVLFSTHYMDEAERLCQRIALMSKGEIVALGTPDELKTRVSVGILRLRVKDVSHAEKALITAIEGGLVASRYQCTVVDSVVEIRTDLVDTTITAVLDLFRNYGVEVIDLHWGKGSLDEVFTQLAESVTGESQLQAVTMEHRTLARRGKQL